MEYTTIAQIDSRLAEAQEEWDFWMESGSDFPYDQVTIELDIINAEFAQLHELRREMVLTEGLQRAVDNFCGAVNEAVEETIQEEPAIEVVSETVEYYIDPNWDNYTDEEVWEMHQAECDEYHANNNNDWLDEELDAMISDPAGTRFLNENAPETDENPQEVTQPQTTTFTPYFPTYAHFLMWVTNQAIRGITYIIRNVNELFVSSQTTQLAT